MDDQSASDGKSDAKASGTSSGKAVEQPRAAARPSACSDAFPGRLTLLAAFEGLTTTEHPVETVLYGPIQDQAALFGLLDRI
jgi:hypothetical protein